MRKIIVAIGGGENGRLLEDGSFASYDTEKIDEEIVKLTNKANPNYLFICHAMYPHKKIEKSYYETMKKIYQDKLNCNCDILYADDLINKNIVDEKLKWADIIYEGGGNTKTLIDLWKKTGFDQKLYEEWNNGKVICGISAGAVCWFKSANSDSNGHIFTSIKCLNWFNYHLTPHCNEPNRKESTKLQLKENNLIGIMLSNSCAIEIIDNQFKIIKENQNSKAFKAYREKEKYYEEELNYTTMTSLNII